MKEVQRIDTKDHVEKLTEDQRDNLFTRLVMGMDVTEEINTSQGVFVVKYPRVGDNLSIGRIAAVRRNFKPADGFDTETEMINVMASTLDVIVVSGPKWFTDAKKNNPNFTFLEVPSRVFLAELYGKAYSFREEVEQRFNEAEKPADQRVPPKEGNDDPVDSGAFGEITNERDNKKP